MILLQLILLAGMKELNTDNNVNVTWTASTSSDKASQELRVYTDASCSTISGSPITGISTADTSRALTLAGDGTYYYQITTIDDSAKKFTFIMFKFNFN